MCVHALGYMDFNFWYNEPQDNVQLCVKYFWNNFLICVIFDCDVHNVMAK